MIFVVVVVNRPLLRLSWVWIRTNMKWKQIYLFFNLIQFKCKHTNHIRAYTNTHYGCSLYIYIYISFSSKIQLKNKTLDYNLTKFYSLLWLLIRLLIIIIIIINQYFLKWVTEKTLPNCSWDGQNMLWSS